MAGIARAPGWKRVVVAALDLCMVLPAFAIAIAWLTDAPTPEGYLLSLSGWRMVLLIVSVYAYFIIGQHWLGGTVWDRLLGIARPQPD